MYRGGLLVGKFVGITGASWLLLKIKLGSIAQGYRFQSNCRSITTGRIGSTMSIFVAQLAFEAQPDLLLMAKMAFW